jgi:hypothetical protein
MIDRSVRSIAASVGRLSKRWLDPGYSYRQKAVRVLAERSGFDAKVSLAMLDGLFRELTEKKLLALLDSELGDHRALDGFVKRSGSRVRARGPKLVAHVFASNVPGPAVLSVIHGLLLKADNVAKPSSKGTGFLGVYLESLRAHDPKLAGGCRVLSPEDRKGIAAAFKKAGLVVAYGSNESLRAIRKQVPASVPMVGYGHKVSFEIISKESLTPSCLKRLAAACARDVWMMDQRGCLSPATFYAEEGGRVSPTVFAGELAAAVERETGTGTVAADARRKLALLTGKKTVSVERDLDLRPAETSGRAFVKPFGSLASVYRALAQAGPYLQAAAVEAPASRRRGIAESLARLGVNRVCRAGRMQFPPLGWHHDGKPNLASWVAWTDLEG